MIQRLTCIIPLTLLVAPWAHGEDQSFDPQLLLRRALILIQQNVDRAPRYTCRQTIHRNQYVPVHDFRDCDDILKATTREDFRLAAADRIRLDVSITRKGEIFSWAGEKAFQSERVGEIVGGGLSGSGDFDSFLVSIFDSDTVLYQYIGSVDAGSHESADYAYSISRDISRYRVQVGPNPADEALVPYQGRFRINVQTSELESLTVKMNPPPPEIEACGIETRIQYHRVPIGDASFLLPDQTIIVEDSIGGRRNENRVHYDACHEFRSESVFLPAIEEVTPASGSAQSPSSFPDFPVGLKLSIRLLTPVDFSTSFAGDPLEGELAKAVSLPHLHGDLQRGTKVYGRLVTCRENLFPAAYLVVGIRWDSIETPAGRKPFTLSPAPNDKFFPGATLPGAGSYAFHAPDLRLDAGFISEWRVTEKGK